MERRDPFLEAEWRHLALFNYEIDPELLEPLVPEGTTLDLWGGRALVSIVGFMFLDTRLLGVPIPLHASFDYATVDRETQGLLLVFDGADRLVLMREGFLRDLLAEDEGRSPALPSSLKGEV